VKTGLDEEREKSRDQEVNRLPLGIERERGEGALDRMSILVRIHGYRGSRPQTIATVLEKNF